MHSVYSHVLTIYKGLMKYFGARREVVIMLPPAVNVQKRPIQNKSDGLQI